MKRALIVVDYQRDFVTGSLGFPGAVALAERIAKKIAAYHKSGDVVLFTMDTHMGVVFIIQVKFVFVNAVF